MDYNVFISHASEDKDIFVRQFANELESKHVSVWYDEFTLKPGRSLRRSIDLGLSKCSFGVVILSKNFFKKEWTNWELDGLVARQNSSENELIIPIWLDITKDELISYSPSLADKVAIHAKEGVNKVTEKLISIIKPDISTNQVFDSSKHSSISTILIDASSIYKGKEHIFNIALIIDNIREDIISVDGSKKVHKSISQGIHTLKIAYDIYIPGKPRGHGRFTVNLGESTVIEKGETSEKKINFEAGFYILKLRRYEYPRTFWDNIVMNDTKYEYLIDAEFQTI